MVEFAGGFLVHSGQVWDDQLGIINIDNYLLIIIIIIIIIIIYLLFYFILKNFEACKYVKYPFHKKGMRILVWQISPKTQLFG
jgi:heme/copper-type cytochrome/quinol oxidase subunit 2